MNFTIDISAVLGVIITLAFTVNIVVQMTKGFIPLPTRLWCVIVAIAVDMGVLFGVASFGVLKISAAYIVFSLIGSFMVAYIAMYGFDTFKELWQKFKDGGNINEDN